MLKWIQKREVIYIGSDQKSNIVYNVGDFVVTSDIVMALDKVYDDFSLKKIITNN